MSFDCRLALPEGWECSKGREKGKKDGEKLTLTCQELRWVFPRIKATVGTKTTHRSVDELVNPHSNL